MDVEYADGKITATGLTAGKNTLTASDPDGKSETITKEFVATTDEIAAKANAKGTAIVNLLQLEPDEKIQTTIAIKEFTEDMYLMMMTRKGTIKKTSLMAYDTARKGGIRAIELDDDDQLINVELTDGSKTIIIGTHNGMAIRFKESDVRPMGRVSRGVRGIRLKGDDYVVGMCVCEDDKDLLVVSELGFGKRTNLSEYKVQTRGGSGVLTYNINEKTGSVAGVKVVDDSVDIMLITNDGTIIRMAATDISIFGRVTKGVTLMRFNEGVQIVSVALTEHEEESADEITEENTQTNEEVNE